MAPKKKVSALIKLQIQAGKANPAPPLGPALGSHGVNIMDFCKAYNAQTQDKMGQNDHRLRRSFLHLRAQDPAGCSSAEEGRWR